MASYPGFAYKLGLITKLLLTNKRAQSKHSIDFIRSPPDKFRESPRGIVSTQIQLPAAKTSTVAPKQTAPARDPATEGSIVTFASTGDPHAAPQSFIDRQAQMAEAEEAAAKWVAGEKAFEAAHGFRRQVNPMTSGTYAMATCGQIRGKSCQTAEGAA